MYSNLKAICHVEPKFFLRTKLPENVVLTKYLVSVATTLSIFDLLKDTRF